MKTKFTSDIVIGMEVHVQLQTDTKLFCSCPTKGSEEPNTRTCVICMGHPGSKPVLNKKAVEYGIKLALALKCDIAKELVFSRKSYFYPDLAKNYQISQYELPLAEKGHLTLQLDKKIGITRVHLEEDPASLVHQGSMQHSSSCLVDYNRSGNPLAEIVTEPDMTSADEARDFMKDLITILDYLGIFDLNNGIIKADANVSIKESNYTRAEIKNITGFKEIERALNYEIMRQKQEVKEGKKIVQETRAWDSDKGVTFSLRTKETEDDYGYILDPDLVPIDLTKDMIENIKKTMPELAKDKLKKFLEEHDLEETTAKVLAKDKKLAEMYESVIKKVDSSLASKWIRRELPRVLNYNKKTLEESKIEPKHMIALLKLIQDGKITEKIGQQLINKLGESPYNIDDYVAKEGLAVIADSGELEKFCKEALAENQKAVDEFKAGKEKALNFVVGAVMRKTKGKADPKVVLELLKKLA